MTTRLRSLPAVVFVAFLCALLYGWTLESGSVGPDVAAAGSPARRLPSGQRLYLLIIDSLALADVPDIPALQSLGRRGFSATVEPCTDKFTTACVREALTGRSHASLFSVLENFKVLNPGLGSNLVDDARALGLTSALVSGGNLRAWNDRVDDDIRVDEDDHRPEAVIGIEASGRHDIVIHHWIWLDVASHHRRGEPERYAQALTDADDLVATLDRKLAPDVGLVVMGDHGHVWDGRHIEGLDAPTFVAVRSPNLQPVHPEGRIPITAIRTITGAVTGVPSPSMQVGPDHAGWLTDPALLDGTSATVPDDGPRLGLVLAATGLLGALALVAVDWRLALLALAWAAAQGATYQPLIELSSQRGRAQDFVYWVWILPPLVGAVAWLRGRRIEDLALGAALGGAALLVGLWPGLARFAVFRNLGELLFPCLVVAVVAGLASVRDRRMLPAAVLVVLGIVALDLAFGFNTNHYRIRRYPFAFLGEPTWLAPAVAAGLGAVAARLVDRRLASALLGAVAVGVGPWLPETLQAVVTAALFVALLAGRPRVAAGLALAAGGFMLTPTRQVGALALVVGLGLAWRGLQRVREADGVLERALPWVGGICLLVGAYAGLGFTMGLSVGGIDFNFALPWFPQRWHVRLWWLVAVAMLLKMFLPVVLLWAMGRAIFGVQAFRAMLDRAARLAVLRFVASIVLLSGWMASAAPTLASGRLRVLLFDGFGWLLAAVLFALMWARLRRADPTSTSIGVKQVGPAPA